MNKIFHNKIFPFNNKEKGIDITVDSCDLFLPSESSYPNPNAVCEGNQDTPLKIAAKRGEDAQEVFEIFQEYTEIADKVKIFYMSVLMKSNKPKKAKEKFQSLLESLPVDLVRISFKTCFHFLFCIR